MPTGARSGAGLSPRKEGVSVDSDLIAQAVGTIAVDTHIETAPPQLDAFSSDLRICRDSLTALPSDGPTRRLRGPIVLLAQAARRQVIPPERMIADLKTVRFHLPHFEMRRAIERGDMMHQLVTAAINAYYARPDD
jgi:hypothetical protein